MQEGERFEAVIMDLTVPGGMGGREATERLLELDPEAKVVAMSGYCDDPVMAEYKRYGFRSSLSKPFRQARLSQVLREVLEESRLKTR